MRTHINILSLFELPWVIAVWVAILRNRLKLKMKIISINFEVKSFSFLIDELLNIQTGKFGKP